MSAHKSGFVSIIGKPNVGKSTLMNALVGDKLSIITPKAQTTRHRIRGIISDDDFQIIISDTPGLLKTHYKMHQLMMDHASEALNDADIILFVVEPGEHPDSHEFLRLLLATQTPVVVVINKADKSTDSDIEATAAIWKNVFNGGRVIAISALTAFNLGLLIQLIIDLLPEAPPYFPKEEITDRPMRFFAAEIIREKIFLFYRREIPYSTTVIVDSFKEAEQIDRIHAFIFVERESQKAILLGHQGKAIKKVGVEARKEIESFTGKQAYLELTVKVSKDWRNNQLHLQRLGFE